MSTKGKKGASAPAKVTWKGIRPSIRLAKVRLKRLRQVRSALGWGHMSASDIIQDLITEQHQIIEAIKSGPRLKEKYE